MQEFIKPMGLSQNRLANDIGFPPRRINEIVQGMDYDLDVGEDRISGRIEKEVKVHAG